MSSLPCPVSPWGIDYSLGATTAQLSAQRPARIVQGLQARPLGPAAKEPPPTRPGASPSPRTSAPAPGGQGILPLPEASISHGLTPRPMLSPPQASGHKLQGLEPSKTEKLTGVLPYSPPQPP